MNQPRWRDVSLKGTIDFHVHTAPDVRPRWYTAMELAQRARAAGMAGFVVKSHHESTVQRAAQVRTIFPELRVYGGITLNRVVGGIDPEKVRQVLSDGGRVVWLPTQDGRGERLHSGRDDGLAVTTRSGDVTAELREIFKLIAHADAILATAHVSADEIIPVVRTARRAGVNRVIVNHPEIPFLSFPVDLQKRLRDEGALLERCFPRPEMGDGFDQIYKEIREVGIDTTLLATDLGRIDMLDPMDGLRRFIYELQERGLDDMEIATVTRHIPNKLLTDRRTSDTI